MKAMICRNCGAGLEAGRIDREINVVTCAHCGSLHDIQRESPSSKLPNDVTQAPVPKPVREEVPLPKKFKVHRGADSMEIRWAVGGFFPGFVLVVMAGIIGYMAFGSGMWPLYFASAFCVYFAATRTFNERRIRVGNASLSVAEGPLPVPGKRKLDTSDITQLFASEYETRTETGDDANREIRVRKHYRLSATTKQNRRINIINGLNDPLQALWLEQEIERLLRITDKPMAGEYVS